MSSDGPRLGAKVRALRRRRKLTQVQLAEKLGISASYLNLIEHDKRPLPAAHLIRLSQLFDLDVQAFADDDREELRSDLMEVLADPMFDGLGLTNSDVREFLSSSPNVARALLTLYRTHRSAREEMESLAARASDVQELGGIAQSRLPSEEVSDLLHRHDNHFPALEEKAELLWRDGSLDRNDLYRGLVRHLEQVHGIQVRVVEMGAMQGAVKRYVPARRLLMLSEVLEPHARNFQLAHQVALLDHSALIDEIGHAATLSTDDSRALARVALANYFAGAALMPYQTFLDAAKSVRYDLELLGHRFRVSFEQVCHRLTNLRRTGAEGVPFHFLRVDVAGNIAKRFSGSGMRFARFSGACSRWNVFSAFLTPGLVRVQLSRMPDGTAYFSIARTLQKGAGAYKSPVAINAIEMGCDARFARELVYADGVDLENLDAAVPIGVTCRLCERMDCAQRAVPPMQYPLRVDENVRTVSFYAPSHTTD